MQLLAALAYNANFRGFAKGTLYRGDLKTVCVPGLNCYSCRGAVASCPLGSLQSALNGLPALPLYVVGLLLVFGILLGRAVCAFLCPFGLVQELLNKIPTRKIRKSRLTRRLTGLKYIILGVFVIAIPLYTMAISGIVVPAFCKYICPVGTLEGGLPMALANASIRGSLGWLFNWKILVLAVIAVLSVFMYRPFCRFLCPLGAIYALMNRFALLGVRVLEDRCIHCGRCTEFCKMDVREINDRECLRCSECVSVCPCDAIEFLPKFRKGEINHESNQESNLPGDGACDPRGHERIGDGTSGEGG